VEPATRPPALRFGPYVADLRAGELRKDGLRIRLQEKSLRVLAALAEQQGQVVTREELRKRLWPDDTFVDFETGLNTAVSKLRDALSDNAEKPRYIETIPRRGYRFLVPVEFLRGEEPDAQERVAAPPAGAATPGGEATSDSSHPPAIVGGRETGKKLRSIHPAVWASLVVALLAAATAVWLFRGHAAIAFHPSDTVLIADFENQTGDPRFDTALGTAFAVSIGQSRYANVFPRTLLDGVLARMGKSAGERITPAVGREICQRQNLRGLIVCSITRTGKEYALTAELVDPQSGETVRSFTERADGEDHILEALDVLAREIREALGESLYQIHQADKPLPEVTTRSLSALQQYDQGMKLWQHGKYKEALQLYDAAIAGDADFAMAHAARGSACYSFIFHRPNDGQKEYEKALSLESRLTDRERMVIEARYALDRYHLPEAEQRFHTYLQRYPDDSVMRLDFAQLLRQDQRYKEAIEQYQEVLRLSPDYGRAFIGMAICYKALTDFPSALRAYGKAFEAEPALLTSGNVNREYGFALVANGEPEKAEKVFSALLEKQDTRENGLRSLAFLDLYRGRYASARSWVEQSLTMVKGQKQPLSEARIEILLATVAEGQGDAKQLRRHLDAAAALLNDIQFKVVIGAILGDAYVRAGFPEPAEKIAAVLRPLADKHNMEETGYLDLLDGDLALSAGQPEKAVELLTLSDKENSTGFSREALANAYQKSGQVEKAVTAYEEILKNANRYLSWEPQQRWLEAHYTLAQDYLAAGKRDKALSTVETLLQIWKDADANLPLRQKALQLRSSLLAKP